jgi:anti-sigma factor RsiW
MNNGWLCFAEDVLETYAWGRLSDPDNAPLEEHLLVCDACRNRLEQIDEYLRVAKSAAAALVVDHTRQNTLRLSRSTVNLAVSATAITAITPA